MMKRQQRFALLLGLGTAVQAQSTVPSKPRGEGARLTEAQRLKVFPETRTLAAQDHRARIAILQQGERCISAATNGRTMSSDSARKIMIAYRRLKSIRQAQQKTA
jgi:hypothetical protein